MNIAIIAVVGLGGLLLSLASKANAATQPEAPQLPPPEPEPEPEYGPDAYAPPSAAPQYAVPQYATPQPSAPAPQPRAASTQPPLEVDAPDPAEAAAAVAEERAEAAARQAAAAAAGQPAAPGQSLSFKKPTPATPAPKLKLAASTPSPTAATPTAKRSPIQAARELLEYVTSAIASGQAGTLGTKAAPNPLVKAAQLDMGLTPADGIYGPATRNKGKSLTGTAFPARDAPPKSVATVKPTAARPAPLAAVTKPSAAAAAAVVATKTVVAPKPSATRAPAQAARELLTYATAAIARKASLGTKGAPDPFVKAAQLDMGLTPADGIYGPATRNKGKALTGSTFPAR